MELDIPQGANGSIDKPKINIEVIVRKNRLEIGNGVGIIAKLPKVDGNYNISKLSKHMQKIKKNYPDKTDATILIEENIEYEDMVKVMDAVRVAELKKDGVEKPELEKVALFPDMSLGEAP
jgi:biopolymer transport protein ExbD